MKDSDYQYLERLYQSIPVTVYGLLLLVLGLGTVFFIINEGKKGAKHVLWLLIGEYLILLLCSTVIFRCYRENAGCNFSFLWSYTAIQKGRIDMIPVIIMNVVVFVPFGALLSCISPFHKWWRVLLFGMSVSLSIEVLQYILHRGFAEVDDIFHNTLGCLIGIMIVAIIKGFWNFCSFLFVPQWGKHPKKAGIVELSN